MLKNESIVCIGFPKWEGEYMKSTVQLMSELARTNRILYIDYTFTLTDLLKGLRKPQSTPTAAILGLKPRLSQETLDNGASIHLLRLPPILPSNWINQPHLYEWVMHFNAQLVLPSIRRAMQALGFERPVVINAFHPTLGYWLRERLDEKLLVYYCYDEISAAPWINKHGPRLEAAFARQADAVITSSTQLQRTKKQLNPRCYVVKNGANYQLFASNQLPDVDFQKPASCQATVGYLGSVDLRLDYDLLEAVIRILSDYYFVFAGRITDQQGAARLRKLPNVALLGPRPVPELPALLEQFDLGVIPFVKNELTANIYPLKVNEYLSRGRPVVATGFADLREFDGHIAIADEAPAFAEAIRRSIAEDNAETARLRRALARSNSWEARASEMGCLLHALTDRTHPAYVRRASSVNPDY